MFVYDVCSEQKNVRSYLFDNWRIPFRNVLAYGSDGNLINKSTSMRTNYAMKRTIRLSTRHTVPNAIHTAVLLLLVAQRESNDYNVKHATGARSVYAYI